MLSCNDDNFVKVGLMVEVDDSALTRPEQSDVIKNELVVEYNAGYTVA